MTCAVVEGLIHSPPAKIRSRNTVVGTIRGA
jgi:hypothetical protein